MAARYETLIDAVVASIAAEPGVDPTKVYRNRVQIFDDSEIPGYVVALGPDTPLSELGADNVAFIDWEVMLFVDLYLRTVATSPDQEFLDMRARVHRALMADVTQGLSYVWLTIPAGADDPIMDDEGERKNAVYRTNWLFRVRTSINDIEL